MCASDGTQIGVVPREQAIAIASERGLDFVLLSGLIAGGLRPEDMPVLKLRDATKMRVAALAKIEEDRQARQAVLTGPTGKSAKEVRLTAVIGAGDLNRMTNK